MQEKQKKAYVKKQANKKPEGHHCHWPGCSKEVPPAMWGCKKHWFMLPKNLRDEIWKAYTPGQEITKQPSLRYLKIAQRVQKWIKNQLQPSPTKASLKSKNGLKKIKPK